ncbi:MAG TPA: hypothetical protein DDZ51_09705 [Planctomycetaceae bacterium]|nr:hypothetical protein [Planctomycetaceae bacterium]
MLLVVDDDSPDGTAHRVNQMAENNPRLRVMIRKERPGLGNATRVGRWASVCSRPSVRPCR